MATPLGRWFLFGLILLIILAVTLLGMALFHLVNPSSETSPPPESSPTAHAVIIVTMTPLPSAVQTRTSRSLSPSPVVPASSPMPTKTPSPTPPPSATPLPPLIGYTAHVATEGETLEQIAERYGSLPLAIVSLNRLPGEAPLAEDQPLVVPLFAGLEPSEPFDGSGVEVSRGLPGRRVALTFDAGADAEPADSILDTLRQFDVQVTFFLTGQWAEENPGLVRRMVANGHEFGNHTYSHPHLPDLDEETMREEIEQTEWIIRDLAGQSSRPYLRPPFGDRNQDVLDLLAEMGYISIYWTVDSWDSVGEPKTPEFIFERVTRPKDSQGHPIPLEGAIILMHVGSEPSAQALPDILAWFQQEGWEVVRLSEILRPP